MTNYQVEGVMQWISKHIYSNLFVLTDEDARLDMVMLLLMLSGTKERSCYYLLEQIYFLSKLFSVRWFTSYMSMPHILLRYGNQLLML